MISKIIDIVTAISLAGIAIELTFSKEDIAIRVIVLMLMLIFLTLEQISRNLR